MSSTKRPDYEKDYGYNKDDYKGDHKHDHKHEHHHHDYGYDCGCEYECSCSDDYGHYHKHHHHGHKHHHHKDKCDSFLPIEEGCCKANTGCEWDGSLKNVVTEPVFVQKVYDASLANLQALSTLNEVKFYPELPRGCRIVRVKRVKCKKFFKPSNIDDPRNFLIDSEIDLSGGEFLRDEKGKTVKAIGPDGMPSQKLIYADTRDCDRKGKGTPVFGTEKIRVKGNVVIEIDLIIIDSRNCERNFRIKANVPIGSKHNPLMLTNFFELCIPSVENSAFFPRFTEFCNASCETRLGTNRASRDIKVCPDTRAITVNLIIALCISCEKKIIVPAQLCVLSSGFPELLAETSPICSSFPSLFPKQIDESSKKKVHKDYSDSSSDKPFKFSMDSDKKMSVMEFDDKQY